VDGTANQQVESDTPEHAPQGVRVLGDDSDLGQWVRTAPARWPFACHRRAARGRDEELLRGINPVRDLATPEVHVVGAELFEKLSNVVEFAIVEKEHRGSRGHPKCLVVGFL
jgi:hypothetical protein